MGITGGIKFFERSSALYKDGTTATSDYASASANNMLTNNQRVYSQSVGANDDTTTVTWTVTYNKSVTIDRVILNRINFKSFTVKYDLASVWTDFTNVVGLDGALGGGITESSFSDETAYYEFDSITTTGIQITATETQSADAEKIIYNLFTTAELGTFEGFPGISALNFSRNAKSATVLSGLANIQKGFDVLGGCTLTFSNYPKQADIDLLTTLYDREESFLVWFCGGRRGTTYFRFNNKGFGLRDIFNMQTPGVLTPSYPGSIYINAPNASIDLVESV
jgi:hypothetical protein